MEGPTAEKQAATRVWESVGTRTSIFGLWGLGSPGKFLRSDMVTTRLGKQPLCACNCSSSSCLCPVVCCMALGPTLAV